MLNTFGIFLLLIGSVLGGFGAAIVWVSQGGFMTALFKKYDAPSDHHGRYFAILNTIVFSNTLWGSIVTTFVLGFLDDFYYFIILTLIGALSILFSFFLIEDVQAHPYMKFV
jgi:MFS family permease